MVGSADVLRGVSGHAGTEFHVLVPNEKCYEASQAAGARVIAVATGHYDLEALAATRPDAVFEDLTDTEAVVAAVLDES